MQGDDLMSNLLKHKGFHGSIEVSTEEDCLHGKIMYIDDLVTYEAQDVGSLKAAFIESVEDYVETCKELGMEPKRPCSGVFNVRISPELHREAVIYADLNEMKLNEVVRLAIEEKVRSTHGRPVVVHHHTHVHRYEQESTYEVEGRRQPWAMETTFSRTTQ